MKTDHRSEDDRPINLLCFLCDLPFFLCASLSGLCAVAFLFTGLVVLLDILILLMNTVSISQWETVIKDGNIIATICIGLVFMGTVFALFTAASSQLSEALRSKLNLPRKKWL